MKYLLSFACIAMVWSTLTMARPVSYPGGTTFMQMNNVDVSSIHLHYSPAVNYSIGYKGEYWRDEEWQFHGIQFNYLINRWNKPSSQANFYLKSGLGMTDDYQFAAFSGIALDWEDRRFFTLYENRLYEAGHINRFFTQKARIGIAPYIGDYGDLHTWLMIQVDHKPEKDDSITITPLIRLFKKEYLVELGVSEGGDALFNFIIRF